MCLPAISSRHCFTPRNNNRGCLASDVFAIVESADFGSLYLSFTLIECSKQYAQGSQAEDMHAVQVQYYIGSQHDCTDCSLELSNEVLISLLSTYLFAGI